MDIELMFMVTKKGHIKTLEERFITTGTEAEKEEFKKDLRAFIRNHKIWKLDDIKNKANK